MAQLTLDATGNPLVVDPNAPLQTTYGAANTNPLGLSQGALAALGGSGNVQAAIELAKALQPKEEKFDPALAALLYFTKMGELASKPGATLLGSASGAFSSPAAYLMQQRKDERDRKSKLAPLAVQLATTLDKKANVKTDFYTNTKTNENIPMTQRTFNSLPNKGDYVPYKAPGAGTDKERYANQLIKIGPKLLSDSKVRATPAEEALYSIAYQQLAKGYTTTQMVNGKEQTIRVAGIDLTKQPNLPIPEGFDASKLLSEKSREFGSLGTNATFAQRMLFQEGIVREVLDNGYVPNARDVTADGLPEFLGTTLLSPEGRRFYSSSRNFIAAVLRKESGAAISDGEYVNGLKQYFPQVGDDPEVISDKEALRSAAIKGMYRESGDAFAAIYPEAEKFMKTTVGDQTFDIINPRSYSQFELAKVRQGRSLFADAVIESLEQDGLKGLLAKPNFATRYSDKQQRRIAERIEELTAGAKK